MTSNPPPYYLADVNVLHRAAKYYFATFAEARRRNRALRFQDMPLVETLAASPLPQARHVAGALRNGTLVTAAFIRDSLERQLPDILHDYFPHGFSHDPEKNTELRAKIIQTFVSAITNTSHVLAHDEFLGRDTKRAAQNQANLVPNPGVAPTDLREFALREMRSRIERVAPENLHSSLLVHRNWYDKGLSTGVPAGLDSLSVSELATAVRIRDGEANTRNSGKPIVRTMDWEDMVILAIAAQWIRTHGGTLVVATGDVAMSQALIAVALHPHSDDPAYLTAIGLQPYYHNHGGWIAGEALAPRSTHPQVPHELPTPEKRPLSARVLGKGTIDNSKVNDRSLQ